LSETRFVWQMMNLMRFHHDEFGVSSFGRVVGINAVSNSELGDAFAQRSMIPDASLPGI
jgi:hypothetical protein